jgi:hypothetical protein
LEKIFWLALKNKTSGRNDMRGVAFSHKLIEGTRNMDFKMDLVERLGIELQSFGARGS